jgi:hypothetical protein
MDREAWFERNGKALMQQYIRTPTETLWLAWLKEQYEAYYGERRD